ncbi:uncharacterized protein L969DRAFT_93321 [Mixia osmundae IAM 14324]|uniref:Major facilitator superfamily (MFS) profile domain-containing protein n=1 Tax=Mixia osmundae (strain CBS 9802 / IAM 14324 / JCM 22182 / KY 12970) TaxID=764103 RepID=G7E5F0_MIXOS|nr:uncharacterized protein L969DRAFT_93321 [Mixia osmundae IAM 14324]KEI40789.1 hypothetical protein L969DRAFT_93321 [Mixia osmundae IAM 14324]GAA98060.1 hypothetical protein E5Q_04741 [Mixia osmundae IAM 14324]
MSSQRREAATQTSRASPSDGPARTTAKWTAKEAGIVAVTTGVTFINSFYNGAVTVVLPTVQRDLKLTESELQWPVSLYSLTFGCFLILFGRLADVYGRRLLFLIGTAHYTLFSLVVGLSPNGLSFILVSAVLGLGAAANTPAALGILGAYFTPGQKKNTAYAVLGSGQPSGFILGLVGGAILTDTPASWRSVFYLQAGLTALFGITAFFVLPPNPTEEQGASKSIDWLGAALSTSGLAMLVFALTESQVVGWRAPFVSALLPISVVLLFAFVYWERRVERSGGVPLMYLSIWTKPHFAVVCFVVFGIIWSFNVLQYYLNLYLQTYKGYSPIGTALRFAPMVVAGIFYNVLGGVLLARVKGIYLVIAGTVLSTAAAIIFGLIDVNLSYLAMLLVIMLLIPAPDLTYTVASIQISKSTDRSLQSLAGALFMVSSRLATSIGLAVTSTISSAIATKFLRKHPDMTESSPEVLLTGYRAAAWVCVGVASLSLLIGGFGLRNLGVVGDRESVPLLEDAAGIELRSSAASIASRQALDEDRNR